MQPGFDEHPKGVLVVRVCCEHASIVGRGLFVPALLEKQHAAIVQGVRVAGIDRNGLVIARERFLVTPEHS